MDAEGCESTFLGARRSWRLKSQGVSLLSYSKRQPHTRHHRTPIPTADAKSDPSPGSPVRILAYILLWSPHARTKNSTFVCETDGSDEGPVSELQRITSQPGIPTLPAGPIGNLKLSNCRRLLTIQYPKPSEALCFCNLALLNRMSVAQNDV